MSFTILFSFSIGFFIKMDLIVLCERVDENAITNNYVRADDYQLTTFNILE